MSFTESLSVEITADSTQFQQALGSAISQLGSLGQQMGRIVSTARSLNGIGRQFSSWQNPLRQIGALIARVTGQLRQLSSVPVSINIGPALQALARLSAAIAAVAAQLNALGGGGGAPSGPSGNSGGGGSGNPGRMAGGGLVTGPSGIDRIPTFLTAGEFVLHREAVQDIGTSLLNRWNSSSASSQQGEDKFDLYIYRDKATEAGRFFTSCSVSRFRTDLSSGQLFNYSLSIHADNPELQETA